MYVRECAGPVGSLLAPALSYARSSGKKEEIFSSHTLSSKSGRLEHDESSFKF